MEYFTLLTYIVLLKYLVDENVNVLLFCQGIPLDLVLMVLMLMEQSVPLDYCCLILKPGENKTRQTRHVSTCV